jgi:hypothetical protein
MRLRGQLGDWLPLAGDGDSLAPWTKERNVRGDCGPADAGGGDTWLEFMLADASRRCCVAEVQQIGSWLR